ncbi:MAG: hypothetical protein WD648_15525 [Planctomycetaceae bacterium]
MGLNKKQKKQIEAAKNKRRKLQQLLAGARQQMDDPAEVPRLEAQIAAIDREIKAVQES